jgi:hypothetical protein
VLVNATAGLRNGTGRTPKWSGEQLLGQVPLAVSPRSTGLDSLDMHRDEVIYTLGEIRRWQHTQSPSSPPLIVHASVDGPKCQIPRHMHAFPWHAPLTIRRSRNNKAQIAQLVISELQLVLMPSIRMRPLKRCSACSDCRTDRSRFRSVFGQNIAQKVREEFRDRVGESFDPILQRNSGKLGYFSSRSQRQKTKPLTKR